VVQSPRLHYAYVSAVHGLKCIIMQALRAIINSELCLKRTYFMTVIDGAFRLGRACDTRFNLKLDYGRL